MQAAGHAKPEACCGEELWGLCYFWWPALGSRIDNSLIHLLFIKISFKGPVWYVAAHLVTTGDTLLVEELKQGWRSSGSPICWWTTTPIIPRPLAMLARVDLNPIPGLNVSFYMFLFWWNMEFAQHKYYYFLNLRLPKNLKSRTWPFSLRTLR